jgi:hypothetical protein
MSDAKATRAHWVKQVLGVQIASQPEQSGPDPLKAEYDRRWEALQPLMAKALSGGAAESTRIRAVSAWVQERGDSGQYVSALQGLDRLEPLLGIEKPVVRAPRPPVDPDSLPSLVQMQQARLTWEATRAMVKQSLRGLEASVLAYFDGRSEFPKAQEAVNRFTEVTDELDDDLIDTLDDALNAEDPDQRRAYLDDACDCLDDYVDFVRSSDLVAGIDANPFTKVKIRDTVQTTAAQLRAALS